MSSYQLYNEPLVDLIGSKDFVSVAWFAWTGRWPSEMEHRLIEACLVACIDHGEEPPSAHTARVVASCGKPLADAVAAGMLTFGPRHGNAGGACAQWLMDHVASGRSVDEIVADSVARKERVPGFGHMAYDVDPRAMRLIELARRERLQTRHIDFALAVSQALTQRKQKPLPLNIDGALGAVMADLCAPAEFADALFLLARTAGLVMHARAERSEAGPYRRGERV